MARGRLRSRLRSDEGNAMLCLLGPPGVVDDGRFTPLVLRPKAHALLAYLALHQGAVDRDELARLLFPDAESPRAALQSRSSRKPFCRRRTVS